MSILNLLLWGALFCGDFEKPLQPPPFWAWCEDRCGTVLRRTVIGCKKGTVKTVSRKSTNFTGIGLDRSKNKRPRQNK
jgi:hypothetical protein